MMLRILATYLLLAVSGMSAGAVVGVSVARSRTVAQRFERTHPMPAKCLNTDGTPRMRLIRDCIVDHVKPLECGGADDPSNMQWQTYNESRVKDKTEASCK